MTLKKLNYLLVSWLVIFLLLLSGKALSQQERAREQDFTYQNGILMIKVYIWGEVTSPGEYEVPENTDILELISKAEGPSETANLSKVKITRRLNATTNNEKVVHYEKANSSKVFKKEIIEVNIKKILNKKEFYDTVPVLQPNDVVRIPKNTWSKWETVIRVISQLAIVAQVWYWYSRAD